MRRGIWVELSFKLLALPHVAPALPLAVRALPLVVRALPLTAFHIPLTVRVLPLSAFRIPLFMRVPRLVVRATLAKKVFRNQGKIHPCYDNG